MYPKITILFHKKRRFAATLKASKNFSTKICRFRIRENMLWTRSRSGCYHVCPNHTNFQFDTAFMYTISILIVLKIYQTRHPDINANAYSAFGVLAFIIFIGVIGVLHGNVLFWVLFSGLHISSCLVLSFQVCSFFILKSYWKEGLLQNFHLFINNISIIPFSKILFVKGMQEIHTKNFSSLNQSN